MRPKPNYENLKKKLKIRFRLAEFSNLIEFQVRNHLRGIKSNRNEPIRIVPNRKCGKDRPNEFRILNFFSNFHDSVRLNRTLVKSLFCIEIN